MTIAEMELKRQNRWLEELRNLKLNAPLSVILRKVKSLGVLRTPKSLRMSPEKHDRNKFYEFHQDHMPTTDKCLTLKGLIAVLIRKNQLLEFLEKDGNQRREETRPSTSDVEEQVCIINAIHVRTGQQNSFGYSCATERGWEKTSRKFSPCRGRKSGERRSGISFREEDLARVQTPDDDPLVVTLRIHDYGVQRILIEGRSSTNILFFETFKKRWLDETRIQRSSSPLIGFEGTKVTPLRMITLMVEAAARTLQVEFVVIDARSAYNAIMRRGWFHEIERVASTFQQVMRCLSQMEPKRWISEATKQQHNDATTSLPKRS